MLVRCSMEHNMWPVYFKYRIDEFSIPYIPYNKYRFLFLADMAFDFLLYLIQIRLRLIHHHQSLKIGKTDLPHQFRADGAGTSCHKNDLSSHHLLNGWILQLDRFPSQNVVDLQRPKLTCCDFSAHQLRRSRHDFQLDGERFNLARNPGQTVLVVIV